MITTLYRFAELLKENEDLQDYYSPVQNPFDGREEKGKVLIGHIENQVFVGFKTEDFKKPQINNYLYRRPSGPKGTGIVPTLYLNLKEISKTSNKLKSSLNNNSDLINLNNAEMLLQQFEAYEFNQDFSYIVTFKVDGRWFGEIETLRDKVAADAYQKYYKKASQGNSQKEDQICAITGERDTVYGFVSTLGFSVNDQSFIRNGFDTSAGYKMFPVSKTIIPTLEAAQGILMNRVSASFFGSIKYAIIPHFIFPVAETLGKEIAERFLSKAALNIDNKEQGTQSFINSTEALLHEIVEDQELSRSEIYYAIMFYEQQQAQFKIHLELNDVLPSRMSKVLEAKGQAENCYKSFTSYEKKNGTFYHQRITLYRLRDYFQTDDKNIMPAYYQLVSAIFTGQPFDDRKLLKLVVQSWKRAFKRYFHESELVFYAMVKETLANLLFLNLIKIYRTKSNMSSSENDTAEHQDAFRFIETHPAYFSAEYLKGAFILGCLVTRLLYNQPGKAFLKELNGLGIDKEIIRKIYPKLISKLRQYDHEFQGLEAAASRYFAINDKASKDEISFAFTMGMVLQKDFDRINKLNKPDNNES